VKALLALLFALAVHAGAHPLFESRAEGTWSRERLSLDLSVSLGQAAPGSKGYPAARRAAQNYPGALEKGLSLTLAGRPLPFSVELVRLPNEAQWNDEGSASRARYRLEAPLFGLPDGPLEIRPSDDWMLVDIKRLESGKFFQGLADAGHPFRADPGAGPAGWAAALSFLREGVLHIWRGGDHLLFVGALALAALAWWDLFALVGAFTLAHSITLSLAVLGYAKLPASLVEPGIALSIVAVALLNLIRGPQKPGRRAARLAAAFAFGLVHGLGFAGGLLAAMQGLPKLSQGTAILSFSAGVELGHLAVVLPLFLFLGWIRKNKPIWGGNLFRYGSLAIVLGGLWYLRLAL
jgi:hypothetical protein